MIALPGDTSASYQLRPPGGGDDWRARADGATLRLVPPRVSHVVPMRRDAEYDPRADQAALSAVVHFEDGSSSETVVILTAVQLEHWYAQIGRLLASRDAVRQRR
ncbi:hypothetical protein SRB5_44040 [Streptomyces sp. RB5]|uniref:Uncharacterized protein n=1 Tax=Streptomyces smaragdinus TaxID=2585196 RepID=A0A7K0CMH6_9ACTN|nr:hypothetical protein [Streptomyces smaragdinus]